MVNRLLTWHEAGPGQLECVLDLYRLLPSDKERQRFAANWLEFLESDPAHADIYQRDGDRLIYLTEHLVPTDTNNRPPLLLVLGNPASHSVKAGMFFSFEAGAREHRFWKDILRPAGVLDLALDIDLPVEERNARRRDQLLNLEYDSPFRIGLSVFISMPSAASGPWSGIAGVRKLIGSEAMARLEVTEADRVRESTKAFIQPGGAVVAFQKNAWDGLRSPNDPPYSINAAKAGKLRGTMSSMPDVPIYCTPPTRLAGPARDALKHFLNL